ncbi:MAG: hypothetical protein ACREQK_11630, partial [Candidatus Binatia bacterium]
MALLQKQIRRREKLVAAGAFWLSVALGNFAALAAQLHEAKRFTDSLASDPQPGRTSQSLRQDGIEKRVLVRPEEKRIEPVHVFGGAKGKFIEQFDVPDAVAFTLDGRLVAGDTDNARFKIYTAGERSVNIQVIGRAGSGPGEFGHDLVTTLPEG